MSKKIFVSVALTCFINILYSQQKPGLSFLDYLKNKSSLPAGKSQVSVVPGNYQKGYKQYNFKAADPEKLDGKDKFSVHPPLLAYAGILPNGNKLYKLPQDNMLCVVPDMSQFNMPVAKGNNEMDKKINLIAPQN